MADAGDSKSPALHGHVGSTPTSGTTRSLGSDQRRRRGGAGLFPSAPGSSRSRCANFFSRLALSRENDARPRASRGGSACGSGESTGGAGVGSCGFNASAGGWRKTGAARGSGGGSSRKGTSSASSSGESGPAAASEGTRSSAGSDRTTVVSENRIGGAGGRAAGSGGSGTGGLGGSRGVDASGGEVPTARLKDSHRPDFRGGESSDGSASRGCGRPKRRSGATFRLYARFP
jgi:hypothetical protein